MIAEIQHKIISYANFFNIKFVSMTSATHHKLFWNRFQKNLATNIPRIWGIQKEILFRWTAPYLHMTYRIPISIVACISGIIYFRQLFVTSFWRHEFIVLSAFPRKKRQPTIFIWFLCSSHAHPPLCRYL